MENMGTKVKVRIYGQDYTIAGDREEETIKEIAAYVDEKMREDKGLRKTRWPVLLI